MIQCTQAFEGQARPGYKATPNISAVYVSDQPRICNKQCIKNESIDKNYLFLRHNLRV